MKEANGAEQDGNPRAAYEAWSQPDCLALFCFNLTIIACLVDLFGAFDIGLIPFIWDLVMRIVWSLVFWGCYDPPPPMLNGLPPDYHPNSNQDKALETR
jgi:hypothetical protein